MSRTDKQIQPDFRSFMAHMVRKCLGHRAAYFTLERIICDLCAKISQKAMLFSEEKILLKIQQLGMNSWGYEANVIGHNILCLVPRVKK
jgi:hypothetical protein